MNTDCVTVSTIVTVDPAAAATVLWFDSGRLLEIGPVLAWEPARRLVVECLGGAGFSLSIRA